MKRPALMALPVVAILAFLATPLLGASFGTPDETVLPTSAPAPPSRRHPAQRFPGQPGDGDVQIVTTGPGGHLIGGRVRGKLSTLPGAVRVDSSAGSYAHGTALGTGPSDTGMARPRPSA